MSNSFKDNFNTLLMETIGDAHVRLRTQDPEYKQQSFRMTEIYGELETLLEDENLHPSPSHWNLVREYFQLDLDTYYPEHTATYIQAIFDCIGLLTRLGQIKN